MTTKELPAAVGARLLDINRTSIYYKGSPISEEEQACKEIIDHLHTDNPTWGARQMSAQLKLRGYHIGRRFWCLTPLNFYKQKNSRLRIHWCLTLLNFYKQKNSRLQIGDGVLI